MSLADIQRAVDTLPADERAKLMVWMVSRYPVLRVESLMAAAAQLVQKGDWAPNPPNEDNKVAGKNLEHACRVAEEFDLGK